MVPLGKKQFALLLLVAQLKNLTTKDAWLALGCGTYRTIQSQLNKMVDKELLTRVKRQNKLIYALSPKGVANVAPFRSCLCEKCLNGEMIRELFR